MSAIRARALKGDRPLHRCGRRHFVTTEMAMIVNSNVWKSESHHVVLEAASIRGVMGRFGFEGGVCPGCGTGTLRR